MGGSGESGAPGRLIDKATASLMNVASMVDCLYDSSSQSMELLEAKRAIHNALVALATWQGSLTDTELLDSVT